MSELPFFKVAVYGVGGVGKTSLCARYVQDVFPYTYDPTVEDCFRKRINHLPDRCDVEILDVPHDDDGRLRSLMLLQALGIFLVYDVASRSSFDQISDCKATVRRVRASDPVLLVLVSKEDGQTLASSLGAGFFETSAKTKANVDECFLQMVRDLQKSEQAARAKDKGKCVLC